MTQTMVSPRPVATAEGVHLVNSLHDFIEGSEFAYYKSAVDGTNPAHLRLPDNTTVMAANHYAQWEGQNNTGELGLYVVLLGQSCV